MSRPRNPAHRDTLLVAATRAISVDGLSVTTAAIAHQAEVSPGTLFNHFPTKTVLLNELFVSLKQEMGRAAATTVSVDASAHDQLRAMWDRWVGWATGSPEKRRTLAQLDVAEDITDESRATAHAAMADIAALLERCRAGGPLQDVPLGFVVSMLNAIADATIDDLIARPGSGLASDDPRASVAFGAIWRAVAG